MESFKVHRGVVGVVDRANVDTDLIIPKQFLKSIKRTGFGEALFFDWRYQKDGSPDPAFNLNTPRFSGASILVARNNFGCGSSREHAVWAVMQYGFKAVIAPWQKRGDAHVPAFADIFRNNSINNGLLTIEISEAEVDEIFKAVEAAGRLEMTIDLPKQSLTLHGATEKVYRFEIDPGVKERLLNGLDEIGLTLRHEADITAFEKGHNVQMAAR
ncbi:MAG TPA: 3-isopropylmalate dehydratase small subunit [Verrucomicrobia bacterium]|nr:MAG: 3-isopropylmalate dehydratase small subunit [Lentisphaerae bacterium GWF2_57_35]HBA85364.1 3-isopropylmalate dehydratase small subunit [Verrucomicrobiota bacterium]